MNRYQIPHTVLLVSTLLLLITGCDSQSQKSKDNNLKAEKVVVLCQRPGEELTRYNITKDSISGGLTITYIKDIKGIKHTYYSAQCNVLKNK